MNNVMVPNMPNGGTVTALIKLGVIVGLGVYRIPNSLYNFRAGTEPLFSIILLVSKRRVFLSLISLVKFDI